MVEFWNDLKWFLQNKIYCCILFIIGICTYGFVITHYSIGIDDTAILLYFENGLAPYMGRWTLYLVNKVLPLTKMSPFFVELISLVFMLFAATAWCAVWKKICAEKVLIPWYGYVLAAGVFVTCPLISEVYVYYLHNGLCFAYGLVAVAVYLFIIALQNGYSLKKRLAYLFLSGVLLAISLGCYESMILVYVIGVILSFFMIQVFSDEKKEQTVSEGVQYWLLSGIITLLVSMLIRSLVVNGLYAFHDWNNDFSTFDSEQRGSLLSILQIEISELVMNLKDYFVNYIVNAFCNLPIMMLNIGYVILGISAFVFGINKKKPWIIISILVVPLLPIAMCLLEESAVLYRAASYVPLITSAALLFLLAIMVKYKVNLLKKIYIALLGILIWTQSTEMNHWFTVDYMKYTTDREIMIQIAHDLQAQVDISKPIVFRGAVDTPKVLSKNAVIAYSDSRYKYVDAMMNVFLPDLKWRYSNEDGWKVKENVYWSTINWGVAAFDGTPKQLTRFWEMHGYYFEPETDLENIKEAEKIKEELDLPEYPVDGYIYECEEYIIVNL